MDSQLCSLVEKAYKLQISQVQLMRNLEDQVYRVGDAQGRSFVLKHSQRPVQKKLAELKAVVALTQAIRQNTDLAVPELIKSQRGEWLVTTDEPGQQPGLILLYSWLDGLWFNLTNMINEFADYGEDGPALQAAFLDGYFAVQPAMRATLSQLPMFLALSSLVFVHWVLTTPGAAVKQAKMVYVPEAVAQILSVGDLILSSTVNNLRSA